MRQNIHFKRQLKRKQPFETDSPLKTSFANDEDSLKERESHFEKFHISSGSAPKTERLLVIRKQETFLREMKLESLEKQLEEQNKVSPHIFEPPLDEDICYRRNRGHSKAISGVSADQNARIRKNSYVDFENHLFEIMNWKEKRFDFNHEASNIKKAPIIYKPKKQLTQKQTHEDYVMNNQETLRKFNLKKKQQANEDKINQMKPVEQNFNILPIFINGTKKMEYQQLQDKKITLKQCSEGRQNKMAFICHYCERENIVEKDFTKIENLGILLERNRQLKHLQKQIRTALKEFMENAKKQLRQINNKFQVSMFETFKNAELSISNKVTNQSSMKSTRQSENSNKLKQRQFLIEKQECEQIFDQNSLLMESKLFRRVQSSQMLENDSQSFKTKKSKENAQQQQLSLRKIGSIRSQRSSQNQLSDVNKHNNLEVGDSAEKRVPRISKSREKANKNFKHITEVLKGMKLLMNSNQPSSLDL